MPELPVLYRDTQLVAVHKPAGMLVHRNAHAGREPFVVQTLRDQLGQHVYPVHRLDRPTSGLMILALSSEAAGILARQFAGHSVRKTYVAVVRGFTEASGVIDAPLISESGRQQHAVTRYERLATTELPLPAGRYPTARFSLVRIAPETGRKHQIRRHFAHLRHPVIGDVLRGDGRQNRFFRDHFGCHRLLLASVGLECTHPATDEQMRLHCPLAEEFQDVCREVGWEKTDLV